MDGRRLEVERRGGVFIVFLSISVSDPVLFIFFLFVIDLILQLIQVTNFSFLQCEFTGLSSVCV